MINREIVIEELLELVNRVINDIDNISEYEDDFGVIREVSEQLKDELESL